MRISEDREGRSGRRRGELAVLGVRTKFLFEALGARRSPCCCCHILLIASRRSRAAVGMQTGKIFCSMKSSRLRGGATSASDDGCHDKRLLNTTLY